MILNFEIGSVAFVVTKTDLRSVADQTLLFLFYAMPYDALQNKATWALSQRGWIFDTDKSLWMKKAEGSEMIEKSISSEPGSLLIYDASRNQIVETKAFKGQF